MTDKVTRGQLLVFRSRPVDGDGNPVTPDSVALFLNYKHADGATYTDAPLTMDATTAGTYEAQFDTKICEAGPAFASMRAVNPAGAQDFKFTITANAANPPTA